VKHPARWVAGGVGLVVVGLAVVLALNVGTDPRADATRSRLVGRPVPALTLPTLDGKQFDTTALAGKTVIVNFWNSWCQPCRQELPALLQYHAQHANDPDLVMIGIVRDDTTDAARAAVQTDKIGWTVALDPGSKAALAFATRGQPETYVVGPDGVIAASLYGPTTVGNLDQMVAAARGRA
jgi:cytochrome c biogenesis protein CcmG/thiol:disulfide interchange protein DsbE